MSKYYLLFISFLIYVWSFHVDSVEVVKDSRDGINLNFNNKYYFPINPNNFTIIPGYANIDYSIKSNESEYKIIIDKYEQLIESKSINLKQNLRQNILIKPVIFNQKINHILIAIQFNGKNITQCNSKRTMLRYMEQMSHAIRLMTGNTSYFDEKNSFFSDVCFPCDDQCHKQDYGDIMNQATDYYYKRYPELSKLKYNSRFFFSNWPGGSWLGMGQVPSAGAYVSKGSYWTFVRANYAVEEEDLRTFCTIIHEGSHNMGFSHAGIGNYESAGFLKGFTNNDNYGDQSSYMGNNLNNKWYNIPGPVHFHNVFLTNQPYYKPWYRKVVNGKHIYRILAWDYPYTRHYLGVNEENLWDENEIIDGIPSTFIRAALIIDYNNDFNTLQTNKNSRICFEYHWYPLGLYSYQNKGVKATIASDGIGNKVNLLSTTNDGIATDNRGELPLGYLKVPDVDIGTIKFKVLKFHPVKLIDPDSNMLFEQPEKLTIKDIPYVDIEIEYNPYVPYLDGVKQIDKAEFDYSNSIFNCNENNDLITCYRTLSLSYYWMYVKPGIARNDNLPRLYDANNNIIMSGRLGHISFPGDITGSNIKWTYGKVDREKIRTTTLNIQQMNIQIQTNYYPKCRITQRIGNVGEFNGINGYDINTEYDILHYNKFDIPDGSKVVIEDIYKNIYQYDHSFNITGIFIMPRIEIQGFIDLFISIKNDTYTYANTYIRRTQQNHYNRVAFIDYDYYRNIMILSSANIFPYLSSTSIIGPLHVLKDEWNYFIFTKFSLKDYILFDFVGKVISGLEIQIETENGIYIKDLLFIQNLEDISLRINIFDIANITGGWGEIYKYRFNQDVTLLSIRPVLFSTRLQQIPQYNEQTKTIRVGTTDLYYFLNCSSISNSYDNDTFIYQVNGKEILIEDGKIIETDIFYIPKNTFNGLLNYKITVIILITIIIFFI